MEEEISSIDKIKLKEQDKEAKLKQKRELDAAISKLKRSIREANLKSENSEREIERLIKSTESLRRQKYLEECRRDVFAAQMASLKEELNKLKAKLIEERRKVWEARSSFCEAVHSLADTCDVCALLMRPASAEPMQVARIVHQNVQVPSTLESENRLKTAIERRLKALAERDRLAKEPHNGEEFVRNLIIPKRCLHRPFSTEFNENKPIKFSTSEAAKRTIPSVFRNKNADTMPWYQPFFVVGSVAVFLIYFCVLREENDVDREFTRTLYDRIKGLEKEQLIQTYKYNKEHGYSIVDIERRLREIEEEEAKLGA